MCMYRIPHTSFGCEMEKLLTVLGELVNAPVSELDQMLSSMPLRAYYSMELKASGSLLRS